MNKNHAKFAYSLFQFFLLLILSTNLLFANSDLIKAIRNKDLNAVKNEVNAGADLKNNYVLSTAVWSGNFEIFKYLVDNGADINEKDEYRTPVLFSAVSCENWEIFKYLVDNGADINAYNSNGMTILQNASYNGNFNIVKYLIDHGADVNANHNGVNAVKIAAHAENMEIFKYLVDNGADISTLVYINYYSWWYSNNNETCINSMQLNVNNKSFYHINLINIKLTIKEKSSSRVIYRKKHTVSIDLDHDEVGSSEIFNLDNNVCSQNKITKDNIDFDFEILSVQ